MSHNFILLNQIIAWTNCHHIKFKYLSKALPIRDEIRLPGTEIKAEKWEWWIWYLNLSQSLKAADIIELTLTVLHVSGMRKFIKNDDYI